MNSDIVLTALELTDDLSGILKGILEKLNKLETIERAAKKIEGSLLKLEERTTKLEALEKTAREDIDNLKANPAIIDKKQDDTKKCFRQENQRPGWENYAEKKIVYLSSLFSVFCYRCNLCLGILIVVLFV